MGKSTYESLTLAGYQAEQPPDIYKTVATREQGKKYTPAIQENLLSAVFQVDGYIIKTGVRYNRLVMIQTSAEPEEAWTRASVELKGHDAVHGMEQLLVTAKNPTFRSFSNRQRKARLVATSFPTNKVNPKVEKLKIEFTKLNVDYKNIKSGQADCL